MVLSIMANEAERGNKSFFSHRDRNINSLALVGLYNELL
jgi:hypothetical protein